MCEFIAEVLEETEGVRYDPKDIWGMSPTGELWPVVELYNKCKIFRRLQEIVREGIEDE